MHTVLFGSRRIVLSDKCIAYLQFPSDRQHGQESDEEGRQGGRRPQEGDEGKESIRCEWQRLLATGIIASILDRLYFNMRLHLDL